MQWSSNFTAIFDGNLPSIDLQKFYGQLTINKNLDRGSFWKSQKPP